MVLAILACGLGYAEGARLSRQLGCAKAEISPLAQFYRHRHPAIGCRGNEQAQVKRGAIAEHDRQFARDRREEWRRFDDTNGAGDAPLDAPVGDDDLKAFVEFLSNYGL